MFTGFGIQQQQQPVVGVPHRFFSAQESFIFESLIFLLQHWDRMPWIPSNSDARLPRSAILGGRDEHGNSIYIGRAWVNGELVPCNVIPAKKSAVAIALAGSIEVVEDYEVLCGDVYSWKKARMGDVPGAALIAGRSKGGEELYIGRAVHEGGLFPGVIQPSQKNLRIAFENEVIQYEEYDVLTIKACDKSCASCNIL